MKKICLISMGNLYLVPYIKNYVDNFPLDYNYDIIYWDREDIKENINANEVFRFNFSSTINRDSKIGLKGHYKKIRGYFKYKKFASSILSENKYDYVVLLQTSGAIILTEILLRKYSKKYIVDIRDYTMENNRLVYYLEKKLLKNSFANVISSAGFKNFLPKNDYYLLHNNHHFHDVKLQYAIKNREKNKKRLNIAFIGFVGYQDIQKKLILNLGNNPSFELSFIGKDANKLRMFCKENNINNVTIIDKFNPNDTLKFYESVDFINNLYGNNTPVLDYALSNKLYYAAELYIPILVCPDTFMSKISSENYLGYTVKDLENKNLGNDLLEYYENIDWELFEKKSDSFMKKVETENNRFMNLIRNL